MSLEILNYLSWSIYDPITEITKWDNESEEHVSAEDILDMKISIESGDKAVILVNTCWPSCSENPNIFPVLTEPITGNTVRDVMKAFERGLHRPLLPGNRGRCDSIRGDYYFEPSEQKRPFPEKNNIVYAEISKYADSYERLELVKKYEEGKLKPYELYGDHRYFEGVVRKGKYLHFCTGS